MHCKSLPNPLCLYYDPAAARKTPSRLTWNHRYIVLVVVGLLFILAGSYTRKTHRRLVGLLAAVVATSITLHLDWMQVRGAMAPLGFRIGGSSPSSFEATRIGIKSLEW